MGPIWGGIVDIYHVIVLTVSNKMTQVSHQCDKSLRSYEAEKFYIYQYMENGHNGHNVNNITIIHQKTNGYMHVLYLVLTHISAGIDVYY